MKKKIRMIGFLKFKIDGVPITFDSYFAARAYRTRAYRSRL